MEEINKNRLLTRNKVILLGIGLAVILWIIESSIHVLVFRQGTLFKQMFSLDLHEIWMRLVVVSIAVCILYAGFLTKKHKQAKEQLRTSLKEKEVLLKEIHHRVRGNLQIISSLINLQNGYLKDKQTSVMLREIQNRVKSMALIHETLYQVKDLGKIDFAEYTQKLTAHLFRSYGSNSHDVTMRISGDNVLMDVDTAVHSGLIINELVSNSLKYAFPKGREGEIRIDLRSDNDNRYTVIVSDNGVGLPEDLDFRNTKSLGLQLVTSLTDQLEGTIELDTCGGTEFKIMFAA
jgi:two-component sensor histidine kinase